MHHLFAFFCHVCVCSLVFLLLFVDVHMRVFYFFSIIIYLFNRPFIHLCIFSLSCIHPSLVVLSFNLLMCTRILFPYFLIHSSSLNKFLSLLCCLNVFICWRALAYYFLCIYVFIHPSVLLFKCFFLSFPVFILVFLKIIFKNLLTCCMHIFSYLFIYLFNHPLHIFLSCTTPCFVPVLFFFSFFFCCCCAHAFFKIHLSMYIFFFPSPFS